MNTLEKQVFNVGQRMAKDFYKAKKLVGYMLPSGSAAYIRSREFVGVNREYETFFSMGWHKVANAHASRSPRRRSRR